MNFVKQLREKYRLRTAVKEALDTLPTAVCYFTPDGSIKLCNSAMYDVCRSITGRDLQSQAELTEALRDCGRREDIIRDGNIFLFPDGRVLKFSENGITTEEGRHYTEAMFSDVTELYEKRRELEQQSLELKKMYADLKSLSGRLQVVTREQEILNMKTRLHDQMNMGITAIRQVLRQESASEENAAAIAQFRRAIQILQEENTYPGDIFSEFIRDAEVAGVQVNLSGEMPQDQKMLNLLTDIFREACVNAALHADATVLDIASEMTEDHISLRITNNGKTPEKEISPRGGLLDIGKRIEKAGGTMEIRSLPEFLLTAELPMTRQEQKEEVPK